MATNWKNLLSPSALLLFLYLFLALLQKMREVKFTERDHEKSFKTLYIFSLHKHAVKLECTQCQGTASQNPGIHPSKTNYDAHYLSFLPFIHTLPVSGFYVKVEEKRESQIAEINLLQ